MAKNWAEKMKTADLLEWKQDNLTTHSKKYKQAAVVLAMRYFRGKPCVFCGGMKTPDSVGHHIYIRSRYSQLIAMAENLIPLCRKHHCSGNEICAHPINHDTSSAGTFWFLLKDWMPKRMGKLFGMTLKIGKRDFQADLEFWQGVWEEKQEYEFVCETLGIEAYPEEI